MNGIKIVISVEGSKDPSDSKITMLVCCDRKYESIDGGAFQDVTRALVECCKSNRYKGWRICNVKVLSMEVQ